MTTKQQDTLETKLLTDFNIDLSFENGERTTLEKLLNSSKEGIVIFVYPKTNTPGCTKQACGFRDIHTLIAEKGFLCFGVSKDKAPAQLLWKEKQKLPYHLICEGSILLEKLGCLQKDSIIRSVFVILKTKQIILSKVKVSPDDSVEMVKSYLQSYSAETVLKPSMKNEHGENNKSLNVSSKLSKKTEKKKNSTSDDDLHKHETEKKKVKTVSSNKQPSIVKETTGLKLQTGEGQSSTDESKIQIKSKAPKKHFEKDSNSLASKKHATRRATQLAAEKNNSKHKMNNSDSLKKTQ